MSQSKPAQMGESRSKLLDNSSLVGGIMYQEATVRSTIPSPANHAPSMIDGPYGGKKPQSGK